VSSIGSPTPVQIGAPPKGRDRPLWSVMIPVYNRTSYLAHALNSVLAARHGRHEMQVEVVDDCSTQNDPEAIVKAICPKRISFYRQPRRVGMAANWNTCIERAQGRFVHILHDDDFVTSGYYGEIEALAEKYPGVGLYSTRCFFVDSDSIITGPTDRVPELERPGKSTAPFFYQAPIQCAGVTVRRTSYEAIGGFRTDLRYVADCEMWARVTGSHGAVMSANINACYRMYDETETARLLRTGENIRDICRLNEIFAERYPAFSVKAGRDKVSRMAWQQYQTFKWLGDDAAAAANREVWVQLTPVQRRLVQQFRSRAIPYIRKLRGVLDASADEKRVGASRP
jgi:glycosyltransferase involved in cell wall biosynthesis